MLARTALECAHDVATGTVSAEEIVHSALARAEEARAHFNAFLTIDHEGARAAARAVDAARARGHALGPLAGVPVAIKDNIATRGLSTTCASRILAGYAPPYDATAIARLRRAGAVIIGKTNMDEFAMGSSNENSAYGAVRNPWALDRVPGGSSGGSAVSVAAGVTPLALGSDTGGSVREPASFCGVVGYKPTYGRVSRFGLVAFGSSLDQIGSFARTVRDVAALYQAIAGPDERDATSVREPVRNVALDGDVRGLRLGVPRSLLTDGVHPDVLRALEESVRALAERGASVHDVELPHLPHCVAVYYIIATAEASSNLARFDGVRYGPRRANDDTLTGLYVGTRTAGFGPEVKRRIMLGTYALSAGYYDAYYAKAQQVRTLIRGDFREAFARVDALLLPVVPTPAFRLGERITDPLAMYLTDAFTIPANLAGVPAVSVPTALSADGLPIGTQIIGDVLRDDVVLRVGAALDDAMGWNARIAPSGVTA